MRHRPENRRLSASRGSRFPLSPELFYSPSRLVARRGLAYDNASTTGPC